MKKILLLLLVGLMLLCNNVDASQIHTYQIVTGSSKGEDGIFLVSGNNIMSNKCEYVFISFDTLFYLKEWMNNLQKCNYCGEISPFLIKKYEDGVYCNDCRKKRKEELRKKLESLK